MTPTSAAEKRRQQNRADARRTILDAAELLLPEVGHDGFSIRRLVARCGYSAPTIYHYFGDKAGLIEALLEERCHREMGQAVSPRWPMRECSQGSVWRP